MFGVLAFEISNHETIYSPSASDHIETGGLRMRAKAQNVELEMRMQVTRGKNRGESDTTIAAQYTDIPSKLSSVHIHV